MNWCKFSSGYMYDQETGEYVKYPGLYCLDTGLSYVVAGNDVLISNGGGYDVLQGKEKSDAVRKLFIYHGYQDGEV